MAHFVGLDVSVKVTSVCIVDDAGKVILGQKVTTEPTDIIALLTSLGVRPNIGVTLQQAFKYEHGINRV